MAQKYYLTLNTAYSSSATATATNSILINAKRNDGTYIGSDPLFNTTNARIKFTYVDSTYVLSSDWVAVNNNFIKVGFTPTKLGPIKAEIVNSATLQPLVDSLMTIFYCTTDGNEAASIIMPSITVYI